MQLPTIVIVAFNRKESLARLLDSLEAAHYPQGDIELVVSIDHSDCQHEILALAQTFPWSHGKKSIVTRKQPLGLREHILLCGDLSQEYGSVIVLEDDLYVSPFFYTYCQRAQSFVSDESRIAGVSLYNHLYNETAKVGFQPRDDGFDNYYLQLPSSWGQAWTDTQWRKFRSWYEHEKDLPISDEDNVPTDIANWPQSSWKKYFAKYMVANDLYFIFPRYSLSTNFMEPGTHNTRTFHHLQVPLQQSDRKPSFSRLSDSRAVYDAYCELKAGVLCLGTKELAPYGDDLTVDLYGVKPISKLRTKYILTSKVVDQPIQRWGRNLKPHEQNILGSIAGDKFALGETAKCTDHLSRRFFSEANYYHSVSPQLWEIKTSADETERDGARRRLQERTRERDKARADIELLQNSMSWKVTKPLRWLKSALLGDG